MARFSKQTLLTISISSLMLVAGFVRPLLFRTVYLPIVLLYVLTLIAILNSIRLRGGWIITLSTLLAILYAFGAYFIYTPIATAIDPYAFAGSEEGFGHVIVVLGSCLSTIIYGIGLGIYINSNIDKEENNWSSSKIKHIIVFSILGVLSFIIGIYTSQAFYPLGSLPAKLIDLGLLGVGMGSVVGWLIFAIRTRVFKQHYLEQ